MKKKDFEVDLRRCFRQVAKRKRFILTIAALFTVAGVAFTIVPGDDKYTATATVYAAAEDGSYAESSSAVSAMNAYLNVAKSHKVSQRAALILGREDLSAEDIMEAVTIKSSISASSASSVNAYVASTATIMTIQATAAEPALSMEMADAMAEAYVLEMKSILNDDSIKVLDNAYTFTKTVDGNLKAWELRFVSFLLGIVVGVFVVVLCEIFDKKVRTVREATLYEEIPVIGIIPDYKQS